MIKATKTKSLNYTSCRSFSAAMDTQRMMLLLVLIVNLCLPFSNGNSNLEGLKESAVDAQSEGTTHFFQFLGLLGKFDWLLLYSRRMLANTCIMNIKRWTPKNV